MAALATDVKIPDPLERLTITVPEAGALLDLEPSAAYEAVKRGEIPAIKVGSRLKVPTAKFLAAFGDIDRTRERIEPVRAALAEVIDGLATEERQIAAQRVVLERQLAVLDAALKT